MKILETAGGSNIQSLEVRGLNKQHSIYITDVYYQINVRIFNNKQ